MLRRITADYPSPPRAEGSRRLVRVATIGLAVALLGCPAYRNYTSYEVVTSSMAPQLPGRVRHAECLTCAYQFACAAETYDDDLPTRCGCCGGMCQVASAIVVGTTVELDAVASSSDYARFDLVAVAGGLATVPNDETPPVVKRIWGMPGEQVDIRDGELWLNGQMLQKDWEQLAAIAVTVSEFPQHKVSHWWLGDPRGDETRLEAADRVISSQGELSVLLAAEQWLQWLYQRPARVHPDQVPRAQWMVASPLIDELDCNQGIARIPHVVEDYWLSIGLASRPKGPASVECSYRGMSFCIDLEPALPASQPIVTETLATGQQRIKVPMGRFVDVAFCDHRLLIRSDEAERILPWHEIVEIGQRDAIPGLVDGRGEIIRISCRGAMMIHRLSIARDLHLLPEVTGNFSASTTGSTGYFLLGDNLAVSADSRGELGRVGSNRLLGRVRRSSEHPQSSAFSIR